MIFGSARQLLFFLVLASSLSARAVDKQVCNPDLRELNSLYCQGHFEELQKKLDAIAPSNEIYVKSRFMQLLGAKGQERAEQLIAKAPSNIESLSELDRLMLEDALFLVRSHDLDKLKKLIDFKSSDKYIESYRKFFAAWNTHFVENNELGIKYLTEAFNELPYIDEDILAGIYARVANKQESYEILKPLNGYANILPEDDPERFLIIANDEIAVTGFRNLRKLNSYFKSAYDLCTYEPAYSLYFGAFLFYERRYIEAESILQRLIKDNKYYSPAVDYYLTRIYFAIRDKRNAEIYLEKSKKNEIYLSKVEKEWLVYIDGRINGANWLGIIAIGLITFGLLGFIFFKGRKVK